MADPLPVTLRVAFLHLAPEPAQVESNRRLIEAGIETAAAAGAAWILTPECAVSGYTFADRIGTGWILPQPDPWLQALCARARELGITLFLSHPERDPASGRLHNSLFVIGPDGAIRGRHRKINALKIGSEAWSSPGDTAEPVEAPPAGPVGLLICADAYTPGIVTAFRDRGARLLVSAASWAPGFHGPENVWETCTRLTGLPLLVCNRTGRDRLFDFSKAESVVAFAGRRLLAVSSPGSACIVFDWPLSHPDQFDAAHRILPIVVESKAFRAGHEGAVP